MQNANKIILITGGGTGLGRAMSEALAQHDYNIVITGRRLEVLQTAAKEMQANAKGEIMAIQADISDPKSVRALFDQIDDKYGRLDVLINNAGISAPAVPMEELTFEQWNSVVASNLTGAFLCTQQAMRMMKAQVPQGGRIINNGSISATTPRPYSAPYTATKHAVLGLTKSTALDGRAHNIACGQIDIGNAATDMTEKMSAGVLQANFEMGTEPTMPAKEIAEAVVYMAGLPLSSNVLSMTVMATKMPFVGRG